MKWAARISSDASNSSNCVPFFSRFCLKLPGYWCGHDYISDSPVNSFGGPPRWGLASALRSARPFWNLLTSGYCVFLSPGRPSIQRVPGRPCPWSLPGQASWNKGLWQICWQLPCLNLRAPWACRATWALGLSEERGRLPARPPCRRGLVIQLACWRLRVLLPAEGDEQLSWGVTRGRGRSGPN